MKKFLTFLTVLLFAATVYAQDSGSKSFSAGLTFGIVPDLASMGATIITDGTLETADGSLANSTGTSDLIMSDKDDAVNLNNSNGTNVAPMDFLGSFSEAGPMMGLSIAGYAMYDFKTLADLPLFTRFGFDYVMQTGGGEHKRTLGPGIDQAAALGGYPVASGGTYAGASMSYAFESSWMEIPLTVGIVLPVGKIGKIYGGLGMSYFKGNWSLAVKMDSQYAQYLTAFEGDSAALADEAINETVQFSISTISMNFLLGMEVEVYESVSITLEYWASGALQVVYADSSFSTEGKNVMTAALGGKTAASNDSEYVKKFAYPVKLGGSYFKFGAKYYIF
jgi:hypothetical protein